MATEYGVQTTNLFALLGDEGANKANVDAPKKKPAATPSQPQQPKKAPQPKQEQPPAAQSKPAQPKSGGAAKPAASNASQRTGGKPTTELVEPSEPKDTRRNQPRKQKDSAVPAEREKRGYDEPAGGRHKRGHFDRQSGTGRNPTENKKHGSGKGNWGVAGEEGELDSTETLQEEEEEKVSSDDKTQGTPKEGEAAKEGKDKEKAKDDEEDDDESKMTLDEYRKQQAQKAEGSEVAKLRLPPPRGANEGAKDDPKWSSAVALPKKDKLYSDEQPAATTEAKPKTTKPKKAKGEDKTAELLNFQDSRPRGRGEGRGRGRGRGRRGDGERGERREGDRFERKERSERGARPDRGSQRGERGDRPGGERAERPERSDRGERPAGRGRGRGDAARRQSPKKFQPERKAPQFDDSSFPALPLAPAGQAAAPSGAAPSPAPAAVPAATVGQ